VDTVYNLTRSGGAFPLSPHRVNDLHREQVETTAMESGEKQHHFVLVHGVCHGAWCWYKVATILESAGHRVTALDMAACGASAACIEEVRSFEEYSRPLLDAVAAMTPGEKAVLVGHSFGGQSLALAMERYRTRSPSPSSSQPPCPLPVSPWRSSSNRYAERVHGGVYSIDDLVFFGGLHPANHDYLDNRQFSQETGPDFLMDCTHGTSGDPQNPAETFLLGPQYLAQRLYQLSPPEASTYNGH
jgi:pimeloyl-ACP methyl ester carboxylesterase